MSIGTEASGSCRGQRTWTWNARRVVLLLFPTKSPPEKVAGTSWHFEPVLGSCHILAVASHRDCTFPRLRICSNTRWRTLAGYLVRRADPPWTNCLLFRKFISNFNTFYFCGLALQLSTSAISSHQSCTLRARLLSLDFLARDGCSHRYLLVIYDRLVPGPLALLRDNIRPSSSNGDLE